MSTTAAPSDTPASWCSKSLLDSASIRKWARVSPYANLLSLALDYLVSAVATGLAMWFHIRHEEWGLHWAWYIPVWGTAMLVNGCVLHRIALMGHESSHYLLHPKRRWNDLLADLLCFFPIYGSLVQYRAKHLPHHLYPNDPHRDPNLGSGKAERLYAKFPMPKRSFIYRYYLKFFWPPFVLANLLDLITVVSIGSGLSPVPPRGETAKTPRGSGPEPKESAADEGRPRPRGKIKATPFGIAYFVIIAIVVQLGDSVPWLAFGLIYLAALAVWAVLPADSFYSGARHAIRPKTMGLIRFTFYTLLFASLGLFDLFTGVSPVSAYLMLWVVPLIYVFPYLMLLREIYQHANAGTGQLDNSRIIHADPFTRWAVLGYGNDFHLIHHLYPNIPHYALRGMHDQLLEQSPVYRDGVEETEGILVPRGESGRPGLIDSLADEAPMPHRLHPPGEGETPPREGGANDGEGAAP